jgi:uncharacterized membrane protein
MFQLFLFLHVTGAVIAFGPNFVFPFLGNAAGREPQHANFAMRLGHVMETRLIIPVALTMLVSGLGLMYFGHIGLDHFWLVAAILIYLAALTFVFTVMLPNQHRLVEMTAMAGRAGPGAAPAGPPPELARSVRVSQMGGMALTAAIVIILGLMIFRPGG